MLLKLEDLRVMALEPLNLELAAGECVSLSGPSGSGKSRLLRAIADLDPHDGRVWLDEQSCNVYNPCEWRRLVGLLPAESGWWGEVVGDHFQEAPDNELLAQLGFPAEVMAWQVSRCSTGERQRLALLRLLANRPRVLLLDEPTASLDPKNVSVVETLVADYLAREGAAALWVSHDEAQQGRIATRHYVISGSHFEVAA